MAQPPGSIKFAPDRPSQFPTEYANLQEIVAFEVANHKVYIPSHQLKYSESSLRKALMQSDAEGIRRSVNTINDKSPSLIVFDVVLSAVVCGRVDAVQFAPTLTSQRKYEEAITDGEEDPEEFETVRLDLDFMLQCMALTNLMGAIGVLELLQQEVVLEFGDAILSVPQLDTLARNEHFFGGFLTTWVYGFSWNYRSTKVIQMHEKAIKEALHESKTFRGFTHKSLSDMDGNVYELDARLLRVKAFIEAWFAVRKQTGTDRKKLRSKKQKGGLKAERHESGRVVDANKADSQAQLVAVEGVSWSSSESSAASKETTPTSRNTSHHQHANVARGLSGHEDPAAFAPASEGTRSGSAFQNDHGFQAKDTAGAQNILAGKRILKPKIPHINPSTQDEEALPMGQSSKSKGKETGKKEKKQATGDPSAVTTSSSVPARKPAKNGSRKRKPEKEGPTKEPEDAALGMSKPGSKKAKTGKSLFAASAQVPPHDSGDVASKPREASVPVPEATRKVPKPAAVPMKSIFKQRSSNANSSSALTKEPTEEDGLRAATANNEKLEPIKQVSVMATVNPPTVNPPTTDSTVPAMFRNILPRPSAATDLDYNPSMHGLNGGSLQSGREPTFPYGFNPDHSSDPGYSYVYSRGDSTATLSQNEKTAPVQSMSNAEGKKAEAKNYPPTAPLEPKPDMDHALSLLNQGFMPTELRKDSRPAAELPNPILRQPEANTELSTRPPGFPAPKTLEMSKKGKGKANAEQPTEAPAEAPATEAPKRKVNKLSKTRAKATEPAMTRSQASMHAMTAAMTAIIPANQIAGASTQLSQPATARTTAPSASTQPAPITMNTQAATTQHAQPPQPALPAPQAPRAQPVRRSTRPGRGQAAQRYGH